MRRASLIVLLFFISIRGAVEPAELWVTVFLHGTVGLRGNLTFSTFIRLIRDDIEHTNYKKVVDRIRQDPFFFLAQPMQELGLIKIDFQEMTSSALFARVIDKTLPEQESVGDLYYTFGWSGLLSPTERCKDAEIFYKALYQERTALREKYPTAQIRFRLICYSHGGSVGLNLATVKYEKYQEDPLSIDELILVGTPIQHETDFLIFDPIFKKVYHIYSKKDYVQKLDCFSCRRFFSRRRFTTQWFHQLPEKLIQIELKVKAKRRGSERYYVDCSPGHAELWSFGWTPNSYRRHFPLYPFPAAAFAPSIVNLVNTYVPQETHIVVELFPEKGEALLRKRHYYHGCKVPWITPEKLDELRLMAKPYKPDLLTNEAQDAHINSAIQSVTRSMPPPSKRRCSIRHIGAYTIP
jgi:hypothetical protein